MSKMQQMSSVEDEYIKYCASDCTFNINSRAWWQEKAQQTSYLILSKLTLNILSISAMSADSERLFSSAKILLLHLRNRLGMNIIEAFESLKSWYKLRGLQEENKLLKLILGEETVE